MNYTAFIVNLIKSVQELNKKMDSLMSVAQGQRTVNPNEIESENGSKNTVLSVKLTLPEGPTLGNAQPNPNYGNAQIPYYLPKNTTGGKIVFTDLLGKIMLEKILQDGYGLLNVDTQELPDGTYSYSLIINEKVIDSKKMVKTR